MGDIRHSKEFPEQARGPKCDKVSVECQLKCCIEAEGFLAALQQHQQFLSLGNTTPFPVGPPVRVLLVSPELYSNGVPTTHRGLAWPLTSAAPAQTLLLSLCFLKCKTRRVNQMTSQDRFYSTDLLGRLTTPFQTVLGRE